MNGLVRFALVAYFPREGDLPGLAELGVDDKLAALRRDSTWLFWLGLVLAAVFFQVTPIVTVRRPYLAAWLDEDELDEHAMKLSANRSYLARQILMILKLVGGLFWAQSSEIRARIGLPAYPDDPGTRRVESMVARPVLAARAPGESLVRIGRKEEAIGRGRDHDRHHALDAEAE